MVIFFDNLLQTKKIYDRFMEPVCRRWGMTRNELDILLFLSKRPGLDRASDIVSVRGITKSHVSLSVSSLLENGYLEKWNDPDDRRTIHLKLTEKALPIAQEAACTQQAFVDFLLRGVSEEELIAFEAISQKVHNNIINSDF